MHTLTGYVEHGDARAREFGFPTANIALEGEDSLDGVWVGYVRCPDGYTYLSTVSVGRRVTFYGEVGRLVLEAHLLDFTGDLYGKLLEVELVHFLRPQLKFDSAEALTAQIHQDVRDTIGWTAGHTHFASPMAAAVGAE